jgi:hypothetical protein
MTLLTCHRVRVMLNGRGKYLASTRKRRAFARRGGNAHAASECLLTPAGHFGASCEGLRRRDPVVYIGSWSISPPDVSGNCVVDSVFMCQSMSWNICGMQNDRQ